MVVFFPDSLLCPFPLSHSVSSCTALYKTNIPTFGLCCFYILIMDEIHDCSLFFEFWEIIVNKEQKLLQRRDFLKVASSVGVAGTLMGANIFSSHPNVFAHS